MFLLYLTEVRSIVYETVTGESECKGIHSFILWLSLGDKFKLESPYGDELPEKVQRNSSLC